VDCPIRKRWLASGKFWFDPAAAACAIAWIETYCRHTEGEWFARPFVLARWQRGIVRKLFGWKRADGTRRYRRLWLEVGRKNGKTEFAAALALLLFCADGEQRGQIYSLATDKDQARIVFDKAATMVALSEELRREIEILKPSMWCAALLSAFKPLSAKPDAKHGFSPSGVIGDEVHAWASGELYEVVHEGEGARAQPLDILITTAGKRGENFAWEMHEHALAVIKGEIAEDDLLVAIFAADDDDDWTDPKCWAKANPNLGISPKIEFLESECRGARQSPRKENRFRQYYLNQWVEQSTRWIPMEYWALCTAAPAAADVKRFLADAERDPSLLAIARAARAHDPLLWQTLRARMIGKRCAGGLDLATTSDLAAHALWFPAEKPGMRDTILWRFWLPRETLLKLKATERARYEAWAKSGALTLTPGNVTDYAFIKKDVLADAKLYRMTALGIDRWNATQLATELLNVEGLPVELFGQGFASMSGPSKEFEREFLGLQLEHGNHPVAAWMARNVAIEQDPTDNIKPTKKDSGGKIDGIVAAIMAKGMIMANPNGQPDIADFLANVVTA
jgi:phage terminase large subunit-like protein